MTTRTVLACVVVLTSASVASGQEDGLAYLRITPQPYALEDRATKFVVWGPPERLYLEVRLANEDSRRTLVFQPGFFRAIRWQLEAVLSETSTQLRREPIVLSVERVENSTCGPAPAMACELLSDVLIHPDGWVTARVVVAPKGGRLSEGDYRLVVDGSEARQRLAETDGSPWKGRFNGRGSIGLVIRALDTPEDRAKYNAAEAGAAMRRGDYAAALEHFRRMAAAIPGDPAADAGVGWALLSLGRFAEAAATLERVWTRSRTPFSGKELAVAYAALGRDDLAESLVKQLYPPQDVQQAMANVRLAAKTLRSRRR